MKSKQKLAENLLRSYIRKEIQRIREAEQEEAPEAETEETPEEPVEEPAEEQGLDPKLQAITANYTKRLKDSGVAVGSEELIDMLSDVIEMFTQSGDTKLSVLKGIRNKIIR
jgi:uncharacterized protein with von Willebrand factor type A (vWA) domain